MYTQKAQGLVEYVLLIAAIVVIIVVVITTDGTRNSLFAELRNLVTGLGIKIKAVI